MLARVKNLYFEFCTNYLKSKHLNYNMKKFEEIWIKTNNNLKLKSYIYNPKKELITIIMCHGFSGNSSGIFNPKFAEELSKKYLVCRFDFRGQGKSEGRFYNSSITIELEDLKNIISYIKKYYQPKKMILLGHSFGSLISILYISKNSLDGLISLSGVSNNNKLINIEFNSQQLSELDKKGKIQIVNWSKNGELDLLGKQFLDDIKKYSILKAAKKIKIPTLIIHGKKDDIVPHSHSKELYQLIKGPKKLILIENADHLFNFFDEKNSKVDMVIKYIKIWLKRNFN